MLKAQLIRQKARILVIFLMNKKKLIKTIIGLVIIGLCIVWIIGIYWPVITGERSELRLTRYMYIVFPLSGIILGGLLMIFGFISLFERSRKSIRQKELKESWFSIERKRIIFLILRILLLSIGIVLIIFSGLVWYGWPASIFAGAICIFFGIYYLLPNRLSRGIFLVVLGCVSPTTGIIIITYYYYLYLAEIISRYTAMSFVVEGLLLTILCIPLFSVGVYNFRKAKRQKEAKKKLKKKKI